MPAAPIIFVLGALALLISSHDSASGGSSKSRRKREGKRRPSVVRFTVDKNGHVKEDPAQLARKASEVVGRPVPVKEFALASMLASEEGSAPNNVKVAIAHTALNRARQKKRPLVKLLMPNNKLGAQYAGQRGRYASTKRPPTKSDLDIANLVLKGKLKDPTGGAVQFDSPRVQRAVLRRKSQGDTTGPAEKTRKTPEMIAMARMREGKEMVTLPGVPADELRFWRPKEGIAGYDFSIGHDDIDILDDVVADMYGVAAPKVGNQPIPKTVDALADKWGIIFKVPPSWIVALSKIESSQIPSKVNLSARNTKQGGAWGLMQITHTTAKDLASWVQRGERSAAHKKAIRDVIVDKYSGAPQDLLDPELNVMLAAYYLGRLRREFDDFATVAAAYHQGPATVRRLLKDPAGITKLKKYGKMYVAKAQKTLQAA